MTTTETQGDSTPTTQCSYRHRPPSQRRRDKKKGRGISTQETVEEEEDTKFTRTHKVNIQERSTNGGDKKRAEEFQQKNLTQKRNIKK